MFIIGYNCKGLNYNLYTLQDIHKEFHVFAKSGINEQELLMGRPYGGYAFFY